MCVPAQSLEHVMCVVRWDGSWKSRVGEEIKQLELFYLFIGKEVT